MSTNALFDALQQCADTLEKRAWIQGEDCPFCEPRHLSSDKDASDAFRECCKAIRTLNIAVRALPDETRLKSKIADKIENLQQTFFDHRVWKMPFDIEVWNAPTTGGTPRPWVNRSDISGLRRLAEQDHGKIPANDQLGFGVPMSAAVRAVLNANRDDQATCEQKKDSWKKSKNPAFPTRVGKQEGKQQTHLFDLKEVLEFIELREGKHIADECRSALRESLQKVTPIPRKKPGKPRKKFSSEKKAKA